MALRYLGARHCHNEMKPVALLRVACAGVLLLAVGGCATASPTPHVAPPNPQLVCQQNPRPAALSCREALAVAIAALPPGDRPTRAFFDYGTYCAMSPGCLMGRVPSPRVDFGFVVFNYAGATATEFVWVAADAYGKPRVAGPLRSGLPAILSMPSGVGGLP